MKYLMYIKQANILILFFLVFNSCIKEDIVDPVTKPNKDNFELLWKLVDEHYCFFQQKNIDWDSIKDVYEPKINRQMSDKALFDTCASMLNELKDGHVNMYSDFNTARYWDWFLDYPQNFDWSIVERNYLGKNCILAGKLKAQKIDSIGYLRYASFKDKISSANVREAIKQLGEIKGLIIDIRNNGGGRLAMVDTLAKCFFPAKKTLIGYQRYKEGPAHDNFSEFFPQYIETDNPAYYKGEIVILTNRLLYSAANQFVSVMKTLSNVTLIGDKTGGGGGMPFSYELYNGWELRLSKNPLYDKNKELIEDGISPDIYVDMDNEDEANGTDTIIEYAINYLSD